MREVISESEIRATIAEHTFPIFGHNPRYYVEASDAKFPDERRNICAVLSGSQTLLSGFRRHGYTYLKTLHLIWRNEDGTFLHMRIREHKSESVSEAVFVESIAVQEDLIIVQHSVGERNLTTRIEMGVEGLRVLD